MATAVVSTRAAEASASPEYHGTAALIRFALRRDRIRIPAWLLGISLTVVASAASFPGIYADAADRQARAIVMANPGTIAVAGPGIGLDDYTFGAMMTNEMLGLTSVVVALLSIFTVVRHSRADEEAGRTELVLAAPVGRRAPLAAALAVMVAVNLALAVLVAVGLGSLGIETIDWPGSLLFAAALASVGVVFGAVAAVTAQVSEHGRTASGLAGLMLGVAFLVRAVGDVGASGLSWLSPIAWAQRTYAYVDDTWWPLLISLGAAVLLVGVAGALRSRRDIAAGLRRPRPGRTEGSTTLATPFALVTRLQRGAVVAWVAAMFGFGLLYGTLLAEVEAFAEELGAVEAVFSSFGEELVDAFLTGIVTMLAMIAVVQGVTVIVRARAEEAVGRTEVVLAAGVSRRALLATYTGVAAAGSVLALATGALGLALGGVAVTGDASLIGTVLLAALVQAVPVVAVVGLAAALYGCLPRLLALAWVVVGASFFVGMLGGLLGLPPWVMDLSPFSMVPMVPAEPFDAGRVVAMLAVALGLAVLGVVGLRRRDVAAAT